MNQLLEKYQDYMRLDGCTACYILDSGARITVPFYEKNFPHLAGIHKLLDIQLVQFWQDPTNRTVNLADVLRAIRHETLTDSTIRSSVFFPTIENRYDKLSYDTLTTLSYSDAIIDFDKTIAHSRIKSDYLLFEQKGSGYNHMGIAIDRDSGDRYIETFFYENSNQYLVGQTIVPIVEYTIYDSHHMEIVGDKFC